MKKLIAAPFMVCLLISCGQDTDGSQVHPSAQEGAEPTVLSVTNSSHNGTATTDPFEGFLSEAETHAYFKSISPVDTMWRYKQPALTINVEKNYSYTEGYLLYPDSKRVGFVTLTCDPWNYGFCNTILEYPQPHTVRISAVISGTSKKYEGYRIVREIKGNESIDYLFKFDPDGIAVFNEGPVLNLTSPCFIRPPATKMEAFKCLTEYEGTHYRFDYSN